MNDGGATLPDAQAAASARTGGSRYAVYWTPAPGSSLADLGTRLFGDAPALSGIDPETLRTATATPARYGLHATLKAPFHLAEGAAAAELHAAVEAFARNRAPVKAAPLEVAELGRYLALRPSAPTPELDALAAEVVRAFDGFRRAPDEAELDRRRTAGLSAQEEEKLRLWGYPYVFEAFRFHVTMAGPCDGEIRARLQPVLEAELAPLLQVPFVLDALSIAEQPDRESPFGVTGRYPLGA